MTQSEYIDNLVEVISESLERDSQELIVALREEGFDYKELVEDALRFIFSLERKVRCE